MNRRRTIYRFALAGLFCLLLLTGVLGGTVLNLKHKSYLAAFLVSLLFFTALIYLIRTNRLQPIVDRINKANPVRLLLLLSAIFLLLNGTCVAFFHPAQAIDYRTFFQTAVDLATEGRPSMTDYLAMFPHILGYTSFLSLFLRLFGVSLTTAVWLNVALTLGSGILLYRMAERVRNRACATLVFLLWTICPSKLLYNTMSLSEPSYTFFLLLAFLLILREDQAYGRGSFVGSSIRGLFTGFFLTVVNAIRPVGVIPIIALAISLIFLCDPQRVRLSVKKWLVFLFFMAVFYTGFGNLWDSRVNYLLGQEPANLPGVNIYVGLNPDTMGSYSDEDVNYFYDIYYGELEKDAVSANERMLEKARERLQQTNWMRLIPAKLITLLGHDEGGAYYAQDSLSDGAYSRLSVISNIWYYFVCLMAVYGVFRLAAEREGSLLWIIPLFCVGLILAQLMVEVAARYHYSLLPPLLLIGCCGLISPGATQKAAG